MPAKPNGRGPNQRSAPSLTWSQVLAWRLQRQHLDRRVPRDAMLAAVADVCGLHAQVLSSAELALWARVEGIEAGTVERALWEERSLVKTWAMRGTLHLLPAAELPRWIAALRVLGPRHHAPSWLRYYGLTRAEADAMLAAIPRALDGRSLTRQELADAVAELTGAAHLGEKLRESWGALLKPAALKGDLCFAPGDGPTVRFARPDRWLPERSPEEPDDAIGEIVRRYLAAYGPATREEFARWLGAASPAKAGALLERLGDEVTQVKVEGRGAWLLADHVAEVEAASPAGTVRLLPAFDHYVVAAPRDVPAVLPAAFKSRVYRPQGWLSAVLLVDGRIDGVWRHERTGGRLVVRIEPFGEVPGRVRRAAQAEAERLAAFVGGELDVNWG